MTTTASEERAAVLRRARRWVRANQCPLPVDLVIEMMMLGLDANTIENDLLNGDEKDGPTQDV